jgi:hypothetical protein
MLLHSRCHRMPSTRNRNLPAQRPSHHNSFPQYFNIDKLADNFSALPLLPLNTCNEAWIDTTLLHLRSSISQLVPPQYIICWSKLW